MHNMSKTEEDGLQQQSTLGSTTISQKREYDTAVARWNWTTEDWKKARWHFFQLSCFCETIFNKHSKQQKFK